MTVCEKGNLAELHTSLYKDSNVTKIKPGQNRLIKKIHRVEDHTCGGIHRDWGKCLLKKIDTIKKMKKNLGKAIDEHALAFTYHNNFFTPNPYTNSKTIERKKRCTLEHEAGFCEAQGQRKSMEDAHFCLPIKGGTLVGVLDGHGGKQVAEFVSKRFPAVFSQILDQSRGIVHEAFEDTFSYIQSEIIQRRDFDFIGSTAVICYLEKKTNYIYTATIGDSEANIYRRVGGIFKSIPLSCVRDWSSKRDKMRAALVVKGIENHWQRAGHTHKDRRVNHINVSRAFGDYSINASHPVDLVTAKPKLTVCRMRPEDRLVLACDGLKDSVKENKIVEYIENTIKYPSNEICKGLVDLALESSKDNVTVVALKITKKNFFDRMKSQFNSSSL